MSVFLDRLMERIAAASGPADKVHALVDAIVEELTAQKDDGTPITITGDVAVDLAEAKREVVVAVVGGPSMALSGGSPVEVDHTGGSAGKTRSGVV